MLKKLIAILSLSTFCYAQDLADKPAATVTSQEAFFKKAAKLTNLDLSHLKHPAKPMLWKVEGKNLKKASYLFGSIHVSDKNIINLHPAAEAAYKQADTLATEIDLGLINQIRATTLLMRKDKQTLQQAIGDKLYNQFEEELKTINPELSADPFNKMKTWAAMLILGMIDEQIKGKEMLDAHLWNRAAKDNKKRWNLEILTEQIGSLDILTEPEQKILLKDSIAAMKTLRKHKVNMLTLIKKLYIQGETKELSTLFNVNIHLEGANIEIGEKFMKLLLPERNKRMTKKIAETFNKMPEKSHFIVAGTLHYIGQQNVPDLLRKLGYTVTKQ